jgi:hypothetical protein
MTCRYSGAEWRDVLYTSVMEAGGVKAAAEFLTNRREKFIHPEDLRNRLRHTKGEAISLEMAELLTEWMQEQVKGEAIALNWLHALNGRFSLAAAPIDHEATESGAAIASMLDTQLALTIQGGVLCQEIRSATKDGRITPAEADAIVAGTQKSQRKLAKLARDARRAAGVE